jgi:hypothetical protein
MRLTVKFFVFVFCGSFVGFSSNAQEQAELSFGELDGKSIYLTGQIVDLSRYGFAEAVGLGIRSIVDPAVLTEIKFVSGVPADSVQNLFGSVDAYSDLTNSIIEASAVIIPGTYSPTSFGVAIPSPDGWNLSPILCSADACQIPSDEPGGSPVSLAEFLENSAFSVEGAYILQEGRAESNVLGGDTFVVNFSFGF